MNGSSQWSMTGAMSAAYSMARRKISVSATGSPSLEKATQPASASSAMGASSRPRSPTVSAPMGKSLGPFGQASRARRSMKRVMAPLSLTGSVLAMHRMLEKPPAAAAARPEAMSSFHSWPGSRMCVCASVRAGMSSRPAPSMTRPSGRAALGALGASSRTLPPATKRSHAPSRPGTRTLATVRVSAVMDGPPGPCG